MELTPEQQAELDEFREEYTEVEMSDEQYLEFVEQNPGRELTLTQHHDLLEDGISPAELLQDSSRIVELRNGLDVSVSTMSLDNLAESLSEYKRIYFELSKIAEKYEYTYADDILKNHMQSRYGIDLETVEFADFKARIIELAVADGLDPDLISTLENLELEEIVSGLEEALGDSLNKADAGNPAITQAIARELENIQELMGAACDPERPETCTVEAIEIARLKEQYEEIQEMRLRDDVPSGEMRTIYGIFLLSYDEFMDRLEGSFGQFDEDTIGVKEAIIAAKDSANIQIGIPPQIFAEGGAHYASLLAEEVKELADQADVTRPDGDTENYEEFLSDKLRLYKEAKTALGFANSNVERFQLGEEYIENLAGYSESYLDDQIEALQMEQAALRESFAESIDLESDEYPDPAFQELGTVDDPAETPAVANIPASPGETFKV